MGVGTEVRILPVEPGDGDWVESLIERAWGGPTVVVHDAVYRPRDLPGFKAVLGGERVGLLTYHVHGGACEVVTLNSLREGAGAGTALLEAVRGAARGAGCRRLWLVTTNDNLRALGFYQRRGFRLVAVHAGAVARAREKKPQIPLVGEGGIPLRDEIELELEP